MGVWHKFRPETEQKPRLSSPVPGGMRIVKGKKKAEFHEPKTGSESGFISKIDYARLTAGRA